MLVATAIKYVVSAHHIASTHFAVFSNLGLSRVHEASTRCIDFVEMVWDWKEEDSLEDFDEVKYDNS